MERLEQLKARTWTERRRYWSLKDRRRSVGIAAAVVAAAPGRRAVWSEPTAETQATAPAVSHRRRNPDRRTADRRG